MYLSWAFRVKILVLLENCQFDSSYYVEDGEFRENIFEEKKKRSRKINRRRKSDFLCNIIDSSLYEHCYQPVNKADRIIFQ